MPSLAEASEAYQVLLEGHRAHPDNSELHEDFCKARAAVEVAWLEGGRMAGMSMTVGTFAGSIQVTATATIGTFATGRISKGVMS